VGAAPTSYGAPVPEELRAALERFGPRHLIVAPMRIPRGVVGTIAIATHRDEPYTDADRLLVEAVAGRAGLALENASLMEQAQRARRDAEAASRLKDEFLTTLSHELRTPLNAIVGWSHMLRSGRLEAGQVARGAEVIHRNAMAQTRLVSDILDMQRIVSGRLRLDLRDVDLIDVVASAIDTVKPAAEARAIEIVRILDPAAAAGWGDPERLQQVAWNLLSNAVKFTPRGGRVLVRLSRVESHLELRVVDNGPGIPPEFLPHVFERFRQADGSATRQHGGLGLGLSIVRSLVELHGGTVEAANVIDGSGAAFTVRLPRPHVTVDERRPAPERRRPVAEADVWLEEAVRLDGTRVLVVDDDPDGRELVAAALAGCGADVLAATSGPEALELLGRQPVDALVCDIHMPAMDGYELVRRLRRLPASEGGHTPAAALTAAATTADRMRALASGFQMHVAKPVQPAELATVVASLAAIGRGLRPRG
jgi:signal transduction histidine kinase/ActR/RegA family two-component response regulator